MYMTDPVKKVQTRSDKQEQKNSLNFEISLDFLVKFSVMSGKKGLR